MSRISNNFMHLGLRVKDFEKTLWFYQEIFGFEEVFRLTIKDFYDTMEQSEDGQSIERTLDENLVWLSYLRIKDEQYLEIFPANGDDVLPYNPSQSFFHFSLQVDDIHEAVRRLKAGGVTIYNLHIDAINETPAPEPFQAVVGRCGSHLAWVKDPDGNLIEVMELKPDSMQRRLDSMQP